MNHLVSEYTAMLPAIAKALKGDYPLVAIAPLNHIQEAILEANQFLPEDQQIIIVETVEEAEKILRTKYGINYKQAIGLEEDRHYVNHLMKRRLIDKRVIVKDPMELFSILGLSESLLKDAQEAHALVIAA